MTAQKVPEAAKALRLAMTASVRRHTPLLFAQGSLMIAGGIIAVVFPILSAATVIVTLGWLTIANGLVQALGLVGTRDAPHYWIQLLSLVLAILIGMMLLTEPGRGELILGLLIILFLALEGMAKVVFALTIRPLDGWHWLLLGGIAGFVIAMLLWSVLPEVAPWVISLSFGASLIAHGLALVALALRARDAGPAADGGKVGGRGV
jgi:uncharacterized membrane protein HdeD (DUF308 family)